MKSSHRAWIPLGLAALVTVAAGMGCSKSSSSNPVGPSNPTSTPVPKTSASATPAVTPNATQTLVAAQATLTALALTPTLTPAGTPNVAQTLVAAQATLTALALTPTLTPAGTPNVAQTLVAAQATLTAVSGQLTQTYGVLNPTLTAVSAQLTQTYAVLNPTLTVLSGQATQTYAAAIPTLTAIAAQATQTYAAAVPTLTAVAAQATQTSAAVQTVAYHATQTSTAAQATLTAAAPSSTPTPTPTATATPIAATSQMLWSNGTLASSWWGQTPTLACVDTAIGAMSVASVTNNLDGHTQAIAFTSNGATSSNNSGVRFDIPLLVNATSYYASGHIQMDIMLGPACTSAYPLNIHYKDSAYTTINSCASADLLSGLTTTAFTHVSIPFNGGFGTCDETEVFNHIAVNFPSGDALTPGVQFYLDNVQVTPN